ncbi:MAG: hypothetical protein Ct9H300mP16_00200 [Pseudomonadota bacterium]|nr:MAG: hypothetical protein Ct9H300mP16_00200 [Pseudomonadota bacterium]
MECAAQVTGGYFADPGYKDVSNLAFVGFPLAEVDATGSAVITKLPATGGCVDNRTVKEQMLYEVHDPAAYLTPDVTADFSGVCHFPGVKTGSGLGSPGRERPDQLKVTVAFDGVPCRSGSLVRRGGCRERARVAGQIVEERLATGARYRCFMPPDLIGLNALHGSTGRSPKTSGISDCGSRCEAATAKMPRLYCGKLRPCCVAGRLAAAGTAAGSITASSLTRRSCRETRSSRLWISLTYELPHRTARDRPARAGDKGNRSNVAVFPTAPMITP